MVADSLKSSGGDPVTYLLGQEYVKGLVKLGDSANSKFVIIPPDLIESAKSIFKK
jgi:hypothetical protein